MEDILIQFNNKEKIKLTGVISEYRVNNPEFMIFHTNDIIKLADYLLEIKRILKIALIKNHEVKKEELQLEQASIKKVRIKEIDEDNDKDDVDTENSVEYDVKYIKEDNIYKEENNIVFCTKLKILLNEYDYNSIELLLNEYKNKGIWGKSVVEGKITRIIGKDIDKINNLITFIISVFPAKVRRYYEDLISMGGEGGS